MFRSVFETNVLINQLYILYFKMTFYRLLDVSVKGNLQFEIVNFFVSALILDRHKMTCNIIKIVNK